MKKLWYLLLPILLISFLLPACALNPVTGKKEFSLMSHKQELALGQQSDPGIVANFGLYEDAELQKFLDEKGKAMAAISHRSDLDFKFRILDSPVVNAFAVPGGYVYFTRGFWHTSTMKRNSQGCWAMNRTYHGSPLSQTIYQADACPGRPDRGCGFRSQNFAPMPIKRLRVFSCCF